MGRYWRQHEQLLDHVAHIHSFATPADTNGQAGTVVWIQHVQYCERPAVHDLLKLKVDCPDVVQILRAQPLLPPDLLHPLVIDAPALKPQPAVDQAPAPPHMAAGQFTDSPAQLLLLDSCHRHRPALRVAGLAGQTAGRSLGNPESILQNHHGPSAAFRAQKFPSASSYGFAAPTASPRLRLEHRLVELGVSEQALEAVVLLLQLLEAFGLCGLHAAVKLLPAVVGGSRYIQGSAHIGDALALVEELFSGPQLADNLLGSVTIAVQRASPSQVWRAPKY